MSITSKRPPGLRSHSPLVWRTGFPKVDDYAAALASQEFKGLAEYSRLFLANRSGQRNGYSSKWVSDPLHNWSRQWEYPFTLSRLRAVVADRSPARILDAGSGFTFFPYYLSQILNPESLWCADSDRGLAPLHRATGAAEKVAFAVSSLQALPFRDGYFDAVYSVSVLEHMTNHARAIDEIARVTRPGGSLLLTFDVSLDGNRRLRPEQAQRLLDLAALKYELVGGASQGFLDHLSEPGVFTTKDARSIDARLLPWKYPGLLHQALEFVRSGRLSRWPPLLAVYCIEGTKR